VLTSDAVAEEFGYLRVIRGEMPMADLYVKSPGLRDKAFDGLCIFTPDGAAEMGSSGMTYSVSLTTVTISLIRERLKKLERTEAAARAMFPMRRTKKIERAKAKRAAQGAAKPVATPERPMVAAGAAEGVPARSARGKYYVYHRATGEALIKGFYGSRADLLRSLESAEFLQMFNWPRIAKKPAGDFGPETLGGFVHWYTCGAIDDAKEGAVDGYPKWWKLSEATRKDYLAAYDYCAKISTFCCETSGSRTFTRRAISAPTGNGRASPTKMISALSSMFKQAVKRGKMDFNPCLGMDKAHEADPNSNREWLAPEWKFAR
jgi:hypothetical protein